MGAFISAHTLNCDQHISHTMGAPKRGAPCLETQNSFLQHRPSGVAAPGVVVSVVDLHDRISDSRP